MQTYRIKNGRCRMEHDGDITSPELVSFTASKNLAWASINGALDQYIADEITQWMEVSAGRRGVRRLPKEARAVLTSGSYISDISNDVYTDVNHGLGLIWKSSTVTILDYAPRTNVIGDDNFSLALTKLYRSVGVTSKSALRSKVDWSRSWVDACAYWILRAYAPALAKR
jgi:hypothetical protein